MGLRGRFLAENIYSRKKINKKFYDLINKIAQRI